MKYTVGVVTTDTGEKLVRLTELNESGVETEVFTEGEEMKVPGKKLFTDKIGRLYCQSGEETPKEPDNTE